MRQPTFKHWINHQWPAALALLLFSVPMLLNSAMAAEDLSSRDRGYLKDIAQASLVQIEASELAVVKSSSQDVRQLAREVIREHMLVSDQLKQLAQAKRAELPDQPSLIQQAKFRLLSAKDGVEFDQGYAKVIAVKNQESVVKLFEKVAARADDADLKSFALKHLSPMEAKLDYGRNLRAALKTDAGE